MTWPRISLAGYALLAYGQEWSGTGSQHGFGRLRETSPLVITPQLSSPGFPREHAYTLEPGPLC
jgi:hypothetical protein